MMTRRIIIGGQIFLTHKTSQGRDMKVCAHKRTGDGRFHFQGTLKTGLKSDSGFWGKTDRNPE
jgi:hypothetical protein